MADVDGSSAVLTEGLVTRQFHCLHIEKDAIKVVEDYLIRRLGELSDLAAPPEISVEIQDSLGTETLSRIEHYLPAKFSDSTQSIEIVAKHTIQGGKGSARVTIRLDKSSLFSEMRATVVGRASREVATGLLDGVGRVFAPYETWHGVFNPRLEVLLGLWIATPLLCVLGFLSSNFPHVQATTFVLAAILAAYILVRDAFPRLTFDSPAEERKRGLRKWWLSGVVTFFVFGVVFTLARRQLLGF